jgi:SSS family solute:Na+ symporter
MALPRLCLSITKERRRIAELCSFRSVLTSLTIVKSAKRGHIWSPLPLMRPQTAPFDITRVVLGLGLVLSFGYWCTDFLLIQRALTARSMRESIQTPLIAAIFKLFFQPCSLFRVLPQPSFSVRPTSHTTIGISAILASLMSGLAGNISALSALWTHDLYRSHINPQCKRSTLSDDGTDSSSKLLCVDLLCPRTRSNDC